MVMRRVNEATNQSIEEFLLSQLDPARLPAHIAIIMDGNGRWAARRNLPRVAGHRAGATAVRRTVESAAQLGLSHLTLYAFSTENWKRPQSEVSALMGLLRKFLRKELATLQKNDIRFRMIGRTEGLDSMVLEEIRKAEEATANNTGLSLNIALNYGGRAELIDAFRRIGWEVAAGRLNPDRIDEETIAKKLYTSAIPDPDLLIRTSGEMRVSNFLIWQIAYAEIYVTETLWPDFDRAALLAALVEYQKRDRRYGGVRQLSVVSGQ